MKPYTGNTAEAIEKSFNSPNVEDRNGEIANVVDVIDKLAFEGHAIANALLAVADAIKYLADKKEI